MAPETSFQLYTIHGFVAGEAMALAWALLPNKSQSTYTEMFTALRDALMSSFGDTGGPRTFLTDFELAAIRSINSVFPEATVKGCSFHFRQALYRRVQREGLKQHYEEPDSELRAWIRRIMSLTVLPVFAVPLVWNWLREPPTSPDPLVNAKALAFSKYFEETWINGDFSPSLWTHFDNNGPRTTNVAEGWHSGLNSRFGVPHPSLRLFLDWLQKCQFQVQCRWIQLAAGRQPKTQKPAYAQLDAQLWSAKVAYSLQIGQLFTSVFPHPCVWAAFRDASFHFLSRASYLLGCM